MRRNHTSGGGEGAGGGGAKPKKSRKKKRRKQAAKDEAEAEADGQEDTDVEQWERNERGEAGRRLEEARARRRSGARRSETQQGDGGGGKRRRGAAGGHGGAKNSHKRNTKKVAGVVGAGDTRGTRQRRRKPGPAPSEGQEGSERGGGGGRGGGRAFWLVDAATGRMLYWRDDVIRVRSFAPDRAMAWRLRKMAGTTCPHWAPVAHRGRRSGARWAAALAAVALGECGPDCKRGPFGKPPASRALEPPAPSRAANG